MGNPETLTSLDEKSSPAMTKVDRIEDTILKASRVC